MLKIQCEQADFSTLEKVFETPSDCGLSAEVVLVDEGTIRRLNREIRNCDKVTDVLSFPSLDGIFGKRLRAEDYPTEIDEDGNLFIGSIALCEQRAAEQAEEYGHSLERERMYLIVHGLLHLLGYDHETEADKQVMREKEEYVLQKLSLGRGE